MGAHTPGLWSVGSIPIVRGKYAGCYAIAPQAGPAFAVMLGNGPKDIREANARLIAAAPRMYALLQRVGAGDGEWTDEQARAFAIEVREVLSYVDAAATGEPS